MVSPDVLLQINATVIAGILILLAIPKLPEKYSELFAFHKNSRFRIIRFLVDSINRIRWSIPPKMAVGIVAIPFSFSSVVIIYNDFPQRLFSEFFPFSVAELSAMTGFVYLILIVITLRTEDKETTSSDTHSE